MLNTVVHSGKPEDIDMWLMLTFRTNGKLSKLSVTNVTDPHECESVLTAVSKLFLSAFYRMDTWDKSI